MRCAEMNARNQYKWWGKATFIMPQPAMNRTMLPAGSEAGESRRARGDHRSPSAVRTFCALSMSDLQLAGGGEVEALADEDVFAAGVISTGPSLVW
jgi:hypothetical protein